MAYGYYNNSRKEENEDESLRDKCRKKELVKELS